MMYSFEGTRAPLEKEKFSARIPGGSAWTKILEATESLC